jgi:SAM-dependent MidA family methyltransferase
MPANLPAPGAEAAQHSARLSEYIRSDIAAQGGWISFARYMELALYAPGLGYYTAGSHKFGATGDFITAPELSPLFGRTIARQVAEIMSFSSLHVLELGAGSGKLAADMLSELEQMDKLPDSYAILEVSADLRARQQVLLRERLPHLLERVHWLDELPEKFSGAIVANEVLDALPVHLVHWRDSAVTERGVALAKSTPPDDLRKDGTEGSGNPSAYPSRVRLSGGLGAASHSFVWQERAIGEGALLHAAQQINVPDDYVSEICLSARGLINSLAQRLEQGALLFIDYGFGAREFYHPQRRSGTLMCHYRHHAHDDPFFFPGLQDITAHVNFSDIAECGIDSGMDLMGYTSQAFFLINCGITALLEEASPEIPRDYLPKSAQLQKLTSPAEMGELFKVIAMGKKHTPFHGGGNSNPLCGFAGGDLTRLL